MALAVATALAAAEDSIGTVRKTDSQLATTDRDAVAAAHARWFAGILGQYDVLSDVLAMDVTLRFPAGNQMPRGLYLDRLKTKVYVYDSAEHHETDIRVYGDAGVVTGKSTLQYRISGKAGSERLAYTAVYVRTKGTWTLVAWQSTKDQQGPTSR